MPKFRKKPVEIEAVQWTGNNGRDIWEFTQGDKQVSGLGTEPDGDEAKLVIETLEGTLTASPDDWIIRGVRGEYYPCKPDIFEATYDPVKHGV